MKKNKILILIENLSDIEEYKKIGINNFLFAINEYSIGYKSFNLDEIEKLDCNKYLLINRVFNSKDCDNFKIIKKNLLFAKGIIFESISVYNMLKNDNIHLIWNQTHFATNYSSINEWLNYVSSAVISNELTSLEVSEILDKCNKPLILNVFGLNPVMYSRRSLLSNFNEYFNLKNIKEAILDEKVTNNQFLANETKHGTILFSKEPFNIIPYINNFDDDKILFYYINAKNIELNTIIDIVNGKEINYINSGFMDKKTIYKLGDKK